MGNIIKKVDNLSDEFSLNYGKNKRLKTNFGGSLTLLILLFILIASSTFISRYFDPTRAEISVSKEFNATYPKINLIKGNIFPILSFIKDERDFIKIEEIPKYFTITANVFKVGHMEVGNPDSVIFESIAQIEYKACNQVQHKKKFEIYEGFQYVQDTAEMYGLCPDVKNDTSFFVEGHIFSPPKTVFELRIYPCSLSDSTQCKSEEDMEFLEMAVVLPKQSFDRKNFDEPIKWLPSVELTPIINFESRKKTVINLMKTQIFDDVYDFVDEILTNEFIEIETVRENSAPRKNKGVYCKPEDIFKFPLKCSLYLQLEFNSGGRLIVIKRNYKKILDLMGEIGGVSQVLFTVFSIFFAVVGGIFIRQVLTTEVLGVKKKEITQYIDLEMKDKKKKKEEFGNLIKEFNECNHDGIRYIKNINDFEILGEAFYEEYHRKLLPLVFLNRIKLSLEKKKNETRDKLKSEAGNGINFNDAYIKLMEGVESDDPTLRKLNKFILENLPKTFRTKNTIVKLESQTEEMYLENSDARDLLNSTSGKKDLSVENLNLRKRNQAKSNLD